MKRTIVIFLAGALFGALMTPTARAGASDFSFEVTRIARALERIADAVDRAERAR